MKEFEAKQQRYARLLLCVFVPMLLLASVHVHQPQENVVPGSCYHACFNIHHNGHLSASIAKGGACVLCHFLTTPYIPAAIVAVVAIALVEQVVASLRPCRGVSGRCDAIRLRAPPVYL